MDALAFEHHLVSPQGAGHVPDGAVTVNAAGGVCCDEMTFSVAVTGDRVRDAGYEAHGCGSAHAAGSAAVELVRGTPVLEAARVGAREIAAELGGSRRASCTPPSSPPMRSLARWEARSARAPSCRRSRTGRSWR